MPFAVAKAAMDVGPAVTFAAAYNAAGDRLVVAGEDSCIRTYLPKDNYRQSNIILNAAMTEHQELKMPITALKFRPNDANNILTVATCDGSVSFWHLGASKRVQSFKEADNGIYAADYNLSGSLLATGGTDGAVRVYNALQSHTPLQQLVEGPDAYSPKAHTSRIQSVRFADEHTLLTGGWDRIVNIWDVRADCSNGKKPAGALHAPYLCGDGIDACGNNVVCASSERSEDQLELFDLRRREVLCKVTLPPASEDVRAPSLYAAKFSPADASTVAVGGATFMGLYNIANGKLQQVPIDKAPTDPQAVFCAAWEKSGSQCFFGGRSGHVVQQF